jgi:thymidylate kinase
MMKDTFTIALIGPDGSGKTTISRRLESILSIPIRYLYMGINPDSSNVLLPTTWLIRSLKRALRVPVDTGPPDPGRAEGGPALRQGLLRRACASIKESLGLCNRIAEEWFRQSAAACYRRRGYVVLFDRHFVFDYHDPTVREQREALSPARRLHAALLERVYPKPDLVICLDAPAEVMFARKGEGTVELLERRRQDYLRMRDLAPNFRVVDASRPPDEVTREVARLIEEFHASRHPAASTRVRI